ncbi:hypothetical protein BDZ94DRAFT_127459 [Collybia nuda]|uniref:BTB domain-containing protein n=1 Tax=Collybia nuda TaxID=64659 RepID=A0A9P6CLV0_9AGAR|nr:hypothetical protein BDZ94DRAFT_127459 [Collybia nuda]
MAAPSYSKAVPSSASAPARLRRFHSCFNSLDADITLRSLEGTLYRVHSYTLRTTSGLFHTMFNLPQPLNKIENKVRGGRGQRGEEDELEEIPIYEPDFILERLLRLICGLPIPPWESYDVLERVLTVAEKWDTPGPVTIIRAALTSPRFLDSDSLRLYAIAKHFEWEEEAKIASRLTLKLNLHDASHARVLEGLAARDLLSLLNLHRRRRDKFKELLDSPERFAAGNSTPYHCSRCGVTQLDNYTWRELKNAMFLEIDRRPLGDTLGLVVGDTAEWPEAKACWAAKCKMEGCGGLNYDRVATLRQIRNCVDLLPSTIED